MACSRGESTLSAESEKSNIWVSYLFKLRVPYLENGDNATASLSVLLNKMSSVSVSQ